MRLDAYTIALLRRPRNAPELPQAELDVLQKRHEAFNLEMRAQGHALFAGPFLEQPDPAVRGMTVYRTSLDETRRLTRDDPLVVAGRLEVDVFTWLVPAGMLGDKPAYQLDDD